MFIHITACMLAKFPKEPSTPKASAALLPSRLLQLLPVGTKVTGRDSHPLKDSALTRRTLRYANPTYEARQRTVPVGLLPPNSWGLYEMHANVREWCADWYGAYPTAAPLDPEGSSTRARVLRGGSWDYYAGNVRSANRYGSEPGIRSLVFGFRLALGQQQPAEPA